MILLFLGSWRSTLVVMTSIPLAILDLPGRALFPGRDDQPHDPGRNGARPSASWSTISTVTIENTHRLLNEEGQAVARQATLHWCRRHRRAERWSHTLAISCVFTSVIFLDGPAKYLFTPRWDLPWCVRHGWRLYALVAQP